MSDNSTKKSKKPIIIIICIILIPVMIYLGTALYFADRFLPNTWIGDVYCTGRSVESVASDLKDKIQVPDIVISWNEEGYKDTVFDQSLVEYSYDLVASVYRAKDSQNPFTWPSCLFSKNTLQLEPVIEYNEERLRTLFDNTARVKAEVNDPAVYRVYFDPALGYLVSDNHSGRLDTEKAFEALCESLSAGKLHLELDDSFYYDAPYTASENSEQKDWEELKAYLDTDLVYDMGAEKISFDSGVMSFLIVSENGHPVKDDEGNFIIDDEAVDKWVEDLCTAYNTYGLDREFESSTGRKVVIPAFYSTYGTELDKNAELKFIREALHSDYIRDGEADIHVPAYIHEATFRGLNDIGDTFIEVDLSDQYMYYYKDGELILETDIVSGDIPKGWTTPRGVFAIYGKDTDTYLYGRDYIDFVSYWMPYFRGYGLHDSDWRDEWGGDIYTYDGSHGCINMDKDSARILYENVEIGTPVVVYDY